MKKVCGNDTTLVLNFRAGSGASACRIPYATGYDRYDTYDIAG